ncbi:hypothetical protein M9Y10_033372 [Tritrichomonas musculus]|uniref:Uncharacterized protein n=1 Tax=Tritrichomonas musculus TaxID=1915356 RepID=A0ABR2KBZ5_9EUKA
MSSFWLCFDPEPARELQEHKKIRKNNTPFLGVFKQNPEVFGRKIQRPITPFSVNSVFELSNSLKEKQESPNSRLLMTSSSPKIDISKVNEKLSSEFPISIF